MKTLWQKEKLLVLSNFFFCRHVFKKPPAAEASESVYMRERVKGGKFIHIIVTSKLNFNGQHQLWMPLLQITCLKVKYLQDIYYKENVLGITIHDYATKMANHYFNFCQFFFFL